MHLGSVQVCGIDAAGPGRFDVSPGLPLGLAILRPVHGFIDEIKFHIANYKNETGVLKGWMGWSRFHH